MTGRPVQSISRGLFRRPQPPEEGATHPPLPATATKNTTRLRRCRAATTPHRHPPVEPGMTRVLQPISRIVFKWNPVPHRTQCRISSTVRAAQDRDPSHPPPAQDLAMRDICSLSLRTGQSREEVLARLIRVMAGLISMVLLLLRPTASPRPQHRPR